jgi:putative PIN family toxin of toxin-antitoxin system
MKIVLDTNVLVAAARSPSGASAEVLRRVLAGQIALVCSVPLFMEYEAVLLRREHLIAAQVSEQDVHNLLNALAGAVQRVDIRYLWRPCLRDANDDMVLETAVNGQVSVIVTSNTRDFLPQSHSFGIVIQSPKHFLQSYLQGLNHGNT